MAFVLPTGANTAEVGVKYTVGLTEKAWKISLQTDAGAPVSLVAQGPLNVGANQEITYQASGLTADDTHRLTLTYTVGSRTVTLNRVPASGFNGLVTLETDRLFTPKRRQHHGQSAFVEQQFSGNFRSIILFAERCRRLVVLPAGKPLVHERCIGQRDIPIPPKHQAERR